MPPVQNKPVSLKISEIFFSLQGEATRVGLPTVFVRLTGCPLRCRWCDTTHAFSGGQRMSLEAILREVSQYAARQVCVTGGEPLAQPHCLTLLTRLCDAGYDVSLETSGALDISAVDPRVSRIVDLKAPGSGEEAKNHWPTMNGQGKSSPPINFPAVVRCFSRRCRDHWKRVSLPNGSSPTACRSAFRCSCTSCCGVISQGDSSS